MSEQTMKEAIWGNTRTNTLSQVINMMQIHKCVLWAPEISRKKKKRYCGLTVLQYVLQNPWNLLTIKKGPTGSKSRLCSKAGKKAKPTNGKFSSALQYLENPSITYGLSTHQHLLWVRATHQLLRRATDASHPASRSSVRIFLPLVPISLSTISNIITQPYW